MFHPEIVLPQHTPPPPPDDHSESEEGEIKESPRRTEDVDSPEEIMKWIAARRKNFPRRNPTVDLEEPDTLSKMEIRMRKRLEIMNKIHRKQEPKKGNPFVKFLNLRNKLLNQEILTEQRVLLQCIKYVVDHDFLES